MRSAFIACCFLALVVVTARAQADPAATTAPTDDELAKRVDGVIEHQMQGRHIPGLLKYANLPMPVYAKYTLDAHGQLAATQTSLQ